MYTPQLMRIIERHDLLRHLFADDAQVYGYSSLCGMDDLASACTEEMLDRMWSKNADMTELIWSATTRRLPLLPVILRSEICSVFISPSSLIRDLGVYIDADLSMRTHVVKTTASCFAAAISEIDAAW